jgi:hypothetical protein
MSLSAASNHLHRLSDIACSMSTILEEGTMKEPGLDNRHRDKNGEISRKHGNTLVRTLRKIYGSRFAPGCGDEEKLSDVLQKFDEASLSQLHRDHDGQHLERKIMSHS